MRNYLIWIGKVLILTSIFAAGLVAGRIFFHSIGLSVPRLPMQLPESIAIYYLLAGSFIIIMGSYPLISNITGTRLLRFSVIFLLLYLCFAFGVTLESSIYSDVAGYGKMSLILLPPVLLVSLASVIIDKPHPLDTRLHGRIIEYFRSRKVGAWTGRLLLALIAWPVVYFLFGLMASPLVKEHYQEIVPGLQIPGISAIIVVQLARSMLFIIVIILLILTWIKKESTLILSIALAWFVFVYGYDIVLAIRVPVRLLLVHGLEILFGSFLYAWIIILILKPGK